MKSFWKVLLAAIMVSVILAACGSGKNKLVGSWKVMEGDDILSFMEFTEERLVVRKEENDGPMTTDYTLTKTEGGSYIIDIANPETGMNEFLFEGKFKNKNTFIVTDTPDGKPEDAKLVRVKNIAKEQAKEEKRRAEIEKEEEAERLREEKKQAKEEAKREKEREEQLKKDLALEEEAIAREKEQASGERAAKKPEAAQTSGNSPQSKYMSIAEQLDEDIIKNAKKSYAHDMPTGFYGQYYENWDNLLQEVWEELKESMPQSDFAKLKAEQIDWIKKKENTFAEMGDGTASDRAAGMDYLANETADRTYYLIENYMD